MFLTARTDVRTGTLEAYVVPAGTTLAICIDIISKYALPPVFGSLNSYANYAVTGVIILLSIIIHRSIIFPWPILVLLITSILNVTLSSNPSLYLTSIYISFILSALLAYNSNNIYGLVNSNWIVSVLFLGSIGQILFLYLVAGIPNLNTYFGGWIFQGYPFGITKAMLGVSASLCVLWALANNRHFVFLALLILFSPLFLSTRTISVVLVILMAAHFLGRYSKSGNYIAPLCWGVMSATIAVSVFTGSFDRLPSYAISFDLLLSTFWGIGHRQYAPFIYENFEALNLYYQHLMSLGLTQVFIGAESMYADIIGTHGVLAIPIFSAYLYVMAATMRAYRRMTHFDRWITLIWGFLMLGGIAQDFTHLNFLFYMVFGLAVSLVAKYSANSRPISAEAPTGIIRFSGGGPQA